MTPDSNWPRLIQGKESIRGRKRSSSKSKTTAQCPDCDWTGKGLYQHRYLKHGYTAGSKAGRKEKKRR